MGPAKKSKPGAALGRSFYVLTGAFAGAAALSLAYTFTHTPERPLAFLAAFVGYCAIALFYTLSQRIQASIILVLATFYSAMLASIGSKADGIFIVSPLLFLAPIVAAAFLGKRVGVAALVISLLEAARLAFAIIAAPQIAVRDGDAAYIVAILASAALCSIAAMELTPPRMGRTLTNALSARGRPRQIANVGSPWPAAQPAGGASCNIVDAEGARRAAPLSSFSASNAQDGPGRERGDFLETVLDAVGEGVIAADNAGTVKYLNRAAREFFGFAPDIDLATAQERILQGANFLSADGARIDVADLPLRRILRGERPPPAELTLIMPDKTVRNVTTNAKALSNSKGEQVGGVVIFRDITNQNAQEDELRWQHNLLELILDTVPVRIWIKDGANRVVKMNNEAAAFFGVSRDESIGMNISDLMPTTATARLSEDAKSPNGAVSFDGTIQEIESSNGVKSWCRIDKARFCDPRTEAEFMLVAATDVTSLMTAKDTLARANAELDQFTRAVSHDLQEPLRKLIIFSEFLEKDLEAQDRDSAKIDLEALKSSALRMRRMIKDLLSLSRMQEVKVCLDAIDPASCIEEAIADLLPIAAFDAPEFRIGSVPRVRADRTLLTQIYQNLISNALKFMPENERPVIEFTAQESGGKIILGVRDNGIGVPSEHRERIFDPLVRLHRKEEFDGTGIGLWICVKAAERLGGRIWIEDSPPRGSHFRFIVNSDEERRSAA